MLDVLLLKPLDPQFLVSMQHVGFGTAIRLLFSIGVTVYIVHTGHFHINLVNVISYVFLMLLGLILTYSLWFIFSTLIIWHTRLSNLTDLLYNLTGLSRNPPEMIRKASKGFLFFLLPVTFIVATPTKVLISRSLEGDLFTMIVMTAIFFLFSRWFWRYALRYYTSASG